jgi:hypothetical protein
MFSRAVSISRDQSEVLQFSDRTGRNASVLLEINAQSNVQSHDIKAKPMQGRMHMRCSRQIGFYATHIIFYTIFMRVAIAAMRSLLISLVDFVDDHGLSHLKWPQMERQTVSVCFPRRRQRSGWRNFSSGRYLFGTSVWLFFLACKLSRAPSHFDCQPDHDLSLVFGSLCPEDHHAPRRVSSGGSRCDHEHSELADWTSCWGQFVFVWSARMH